MPVFMPYIKRSPATSAFVGVTCGSKSSVLWGLAKVLPSEGLLELGDAIPDVVLHDPRTNSNITLTNILGLPNAHLMLLLGEHGNMPIVLNFGSIT
ncbi:uncharacterized protein ACA1_176740 [Acanthamoeba castellanii str. Neff]|uniref:Uncharacterized protein n=1 Tax=Acanthamoeba castellanii (strain ATCC 30010 / Neff) TaxID=1257118 RepID=L8GVN4_ACACF|nr:uncharacterized protein ACA1_176740 [Acanthamoeba castellanii str. Neff]ELR16116.1 hypothetical protein ACA1_176740 [Acanthamoeba castellanii str. Neff]